MNTSTADPGGSGGNSSRSDPYTISVIVCIVLSVILVVMYIVVVCDNKQRRETARREQLVKSVIDAIQDISKDEHVYRKPNESRVYTITEEDDQLPDPDVDNLN